MTHHRLSHTINRFSYKTLFIILLFLLIPIVFLLKINQKGQIVKASWWNDSWTYRQRVDIAGVGSSPSNFQVSISIGTSALIAAGKMQSNCADIRITDQSGNILPYWIETGTNACNTATTAIWTKVPSIPAGGATVYLYYGNPSAPSVQNGNNVFLFFDDFSGSTIDTAKWTSQTGSPSTSGGELILPSSSGLFAGNYQIPENTVWEARSNPQATNRTGAAIRAATSSTYGWVSDGDTNIVDTLWWTNNNIYAEWNGGENGWYSGYSSGYAKYKIAYRPGSADTAYYYYNGANQYTRNGNVTQGVYPVMHSYNGESRFDYFFIRTYAATEPTVASPTNEEKSQGPVAYWKFDEGHGVTAQNSTWKKTGTTTNLITNPSLEINTTGWDYPFGNGSLSTTNSTSLFGSTAGQVTIATNYGYSRARFSNIPVSSSSTYTFSVWVKGSAGSIGKTVGLSSIGNDSGETVGGNTVLDNTWKRISMTKVTNVSDTTLTEAIYISNDTSGEIFYFDGAQLELSSINNYCDGSLLGNGSHVWNGTTNASTSTCDTGTDGEIDGATWQTNDQCVTGKCLSFDGTNDYVISSSNPSTSQIFTTSFWFYTPTPSANMYLLDRGGNKHWFELYNSKLRTGTSASNYSDSTTTIQANTWYFVTMTYDGTNIKQYINGTREFSIGGGNVTPSGLQLAQYYGGTTYFNGKMDDVKIYNYARTATQIKNDYSSGLAGQSTSKGSNTSFSSSSNKSLSDGLIAYYKMDEGVGTTTADSSGNNNTGTISGTTWSTGKYGIGMSFDGTSYVTAGQTVPSTISISTWATFSADGMMWNHANGVGPDLWFSGGNIYLNTWDGYSNPLCAVPSDANNGLFHHYVLINTSPTASLYYDGRLCGTASYRNPAGAFIISSGESSYGWQGKIDEVRVYNRAINPTEVKALYNYAPGPVAYYNFEEGNGNILNDKSGNGLNSSSLTGTITWTSGKIGKALYFNKNLYADMGNSSLINNLNQFTVETWIKLDSLVTSPANEVFISKVNGDCSGNGWRIQQNNAVVSLTCGTVPSVAVTIPDTNWHHIAFSVANNGTTFTSVSYLDGIYRSTSSAAAAGLNNNFNLYLGDYTAGGNPYNYKGKLDDFKLYSYARTPEQILQDMGGQNVAGAPSKMGQPVAYYKFDDGYGTVAKDSTGNNPDFTFANSTAWASNCKFGKCLNFPTNSDSASFTVPSSSPFNLGSSDFTISNWQKVPQPTTAGSGILGRYPHNTSFNGNWVAGIFDNMTTYFFGHRNTSGEMAFWTGIDYTEYFGNWTYVSWVKSDTTISLYINGKFNQSWQQSYAFDITFSGVPFYISNTGWAPGTMNGLQVDELKIYNYALTSDEIKTDYNQGASTVIGTKNGDVSDDPVAYWKLDEGTYNGTTNEVKDSIGSNNGTSGNGATASTGKINGAVLHDSDSYIAVSDSSTLDITDKLTMEYWFMPSVDVTSMGTYPIGVFKRNWAVGGYGSHFYNGDGTVNFQWCWVGGCDGVSSTTSFKANRWYHYAATYDGSSVHLYINGIQENSKAVGTTMASSAGYPLYLGLGGWQGKIDEVKIYHYARSDTQIKADAATDTLNPVLPGSPVGEWNFEEGTGTTAYDTSGNGNNGVFGAGNSAPTWTTGKIGKALSFDGSNDYVSLPASVSNGLTQFTIGLWIKTTTTASDATYWNRPPFIGFDTGGCNSGDFGITINSGYLGMWSGLNNSGCDNSVQTNSIINNNQWHHIEAVNNGTIIKLYLDGQDIGSSLASGLALANNSFSVGAAIGTQKFFYQGLIDNVKIYNYARTPAQVAYDYNRGAPVAQWKMDECQGNIVHDSSGNGNDGTINIGTSGTQISLGTCQIGDTSAWSNGATGKLNSSLNFDGSDDYVSVPYSSSLQLGNNLTIGMWAKRNGGLGAYRSLLVKRSGSNCEYSLYFAPSNQLQFWIYDGSWHSFTGTNTITDSNWHYLTFTWDGLTGKTYIDGVLDNNSGFSYTPLESGSSPLQIAGDSGYPGTRNFPGQLDDVRIYNYALTTDQIKTIYNGGSVNFQ